MKTLFNSAIMASCIVLSVSADKTAHEVFAANKETILSQPVTVCGEVSFSVGCSNSPRSRGDAVGYTKAEEQAKWNLGEKYRAMAIWPSDVLDSEKGLAWAEYRSQHPDRFSVAGMYRIYTKKTRPDTYTVVLCFPSNQVKVPEPTAEELQVALNTVRERRRLAAERASLMAQGVEQKGAQVSASDEASVQATHNSESDGRQNGEIKKNEHLEEDLML